MAFISSDHIKGKIFIPDKGADLPQKRPCRDCFSCQKCSASRCNLCRGPETAVPDKPGDEAGE